MHNIKKLIEPHTAFWGYHLILLLGNTIQYTLPDSFVSNICFYLAFVYAVLSVILSNVHKFSLLITLGIAVSFLFVENMLFQANTLYFSENVKTMILTCLPCLLLAFSISDFNKLLENAERIIIPYMSLCLVLLYFTLSGYTFTENVNYMTIAYNLSLPTLLLGYISLEKNSSILTTAFVVVSLALLLVGCRGAFVSIILPYLLLYVQKRDVHRTVLIGLFVVLFILYFWFDPILEMTDNLLASAGYDSRIISKIRYGGLFESEGREILRETVTGRASQEGWPAYGLFGDRTIAASAGLDAVYIHNVVLEFIIDFGVLMGSILLVILIYSMFSHYKKGSESYRTVFVIFWGICLMKLMFSGSYLVEPLFYLSFGLLINKYHICKL